MGKKVIILFGPPGAGKGTQAELLASKLDFYYFETSRILEREFGNPSEESVEVDGERFEVSNEKKLWLEGKLCSPPFVSYLVKKNIKELAEQGESLILAGSPRTVYEAENVMPLVEELYGLKNIKAVLLDIKPETTVYRNSHRRICELMRHSILYNEETKNLTMCVLDGSKLIRRKGLDDPETIKVRLEEYKNRTLPILEVLGKQGVKVKKVDGENTPAEVHKDILGAIK
jgi:adenylate kinase